MMTDTNGTDRDGEKDEAIVRRVRAGDREAFALLVDRYQKMVYGLAYCHLGQTEDAQDAAQEAFVLAYRRLPQLADPARFAPWLRKVTLNACRVLRRRERFDAALSESLPAPDILGGVDTRLTVREALKVLSPETRLTLTLFYFHDRSLDEIAAFLSVPVTTVKSRLRDARARLRKELTPMMPEPLKPEPLPRDFTARVMRDIQAKGTVHFAAFSPDGRRVATLGYWLEENEDRASCVQVWDTDAGELLATAPVASWSRAARWSPDGQTLGFCCGTTPKSYRPSAFRLWRWQEGTSRQMDVDEGGAMAAAFSPDGQTAALGIKVWNEVDKGTAFVRVVRLADGTPLWEAEHPAQTWAAVFAPDGRTLATGSGIPVPEAGKEGWLGGDVRLWDAATGSLIHTLSRPNARAQSKLSFSPDGGLVATGDGPEGDVLVWEVKSGALRRTLSGHTDTVFAVAFSPAGNLLATGGKDGRVCLWDVHSGELRKTLTEHRTAVHDVSFAADATTLLSADLDGMIKLWKVGQ